MQRPPTACAFWPHFHLYTHRVVKRSGVPSSLLSQHISPDFNPVVLFSLQLNAHYATLGPFAINRYDSKLGEKQRRGEILSCSYRKKVRSARRGWAERSSSVPWISRRVSYCKLSCNLFLALLTGSPCLLLLCRNELGWLSIPWRNRD